MSVKAKSDSSIITSNALTPPHAIGARAFFLRVASERVSRFSSPLSLFFPFSLPFRRIRLLYSAAGREISIWKLAAEGAETQLGSLLIVQYSSQLSSSSIARAKEFRLPSISTATSSARRFQRARQHDFLGTLNGI